MKLRKISAFVLALTLSAGAFLSGCDPKADKTGGQSQTTSQQTSSADTSLEKVMEKKELVLGLDATFKPMGFKNEKDEIVGFDIDVAKEVCKRLGIKLVTRGIDWDTKEQTLNAGNIDCIWNGLSISPERAEAMALSVPYMKNSMVFVVKGDSSIASQADLKGKKVAVQSGSTAQEILQKSNIGASETALATNVEALKQLELNLVDAVFMDSVVAQYEINTSKKNYKILPDGLKEEEYAIGFRKNDLALKKKIESVLKELKADGTLGKISTKWFGSDITTVK